MKGQPLDEDALRALPQDVLGKLRRAVVAARYDEIVDLIETIRITDPNIAAELRRMADLFDYDGMQNLLKRCPAIGAQQAQQNAVPMRTPRGG